MTYFKKHWPEDLHDDVRTCVEDIVSVFEYFYSSIRTSQIFTQFRERWLEMKATVATSSGSLKKGKASTLKKVIRHVLSDDEDNDTTSAAPAVGGGFNEQGWLNDFNAYWNTIEAALPAGMSTITWWGVCISHSSSNLPCD